jgi:hypothetical protein
MTRSLGALLLFVTAGFSLAAAQVVSFNEPVAWMTVTDRSITAKMLLDTARIEKPKIRLSLVKVKNGRRRTVRSRTFSVKDYSQEFDLGSVGESVLGGNDFLSIEWSIPGQADKGVLEPVGVVELDESKIETVLEGVQVEGKLDTASAAAKAEKARFAEVGGHKLGMLWNEEVFALIIREGSELGSVTMMIDGKNGKNAFLSYPDRVLTWRVGIEALEAFHHRRVEADTTINYPRAKWMHGITSAKKEKGAVIVVPWHDTGILPFVGRRAGVMLSAVAESGATPVTLPADAREKIPGTWGDMVLIGKE